MIIHGTPNLPETIGELSERLSHLTADMATVAAHAGDQVTIGNSTVSRKDATTVLGERLASLPEWVREPRRIPLGIYRGLRFGLVLNPQFPPEAYLEGRTTRLAMLSREHHGPRAVLNAADRLARGYDSECARVRQDLAIAQGQLRDYEARLGAPFVHEVYLSGLTALRDKLKSGLSGVPAETGSEPPPTVSELAKGIKALMEGHTAEPRRLRRGVPRLLGGRCPSGRTPALGQPEGVGGKDWRRNGRRAPQIRAARRDDPAGGPRHRVIDESPGGAASAAAPPPLADAPGPPQMLRFAEPPGEMNVLTGDLASVPPPHRCSGHLC
jgi:hypothetical protein